MRRDLVTWANAITAFRFVGVVGMIFWPNRPAGSWVLLLFVFLFWICDSLDGWVARKLKQQSALGGALDLAADRLLDLSCGLWLLFRGVGAVDAALIAAYSLTRFALEPLVFSAARDAPEVGPRWARRLALEYSAAVKAFYFGSLILACVGSGVECPDPRLDILRAGMVALTLGYAAHVAYVLSQAWNRSR